MRVWIGTYRSRSIVMKTLDSNTIVSFVFDTAKARLTFPHSVMAATLYHDGCSAYFCEANYQKSLGESIFQDRVVSGQVEVEVRN